MDLGSGRKCSMSFGITEEVRILTLLFTSLITLGQLMPGLRICM